LDSENKVAVVEQNVVWMRKKINACSIMVEKLLAWKTNNDKR
jgi:hypothetical protein